MCELQAALEFQVELSKFYNVDLFQRGYYQIRTALKTAPRVPIKVEVSLPRNSESDLIFPASVINGVAVSKTFQILYRNEDVTINDVVIFKVQMLVDANKVEESIAAAEFHLGIDLWFTDEEMGRKVVFSPEQQEKLQCISERVVALHLTPAAGGLHHHLPLLFDYFHLCVVCITVHATLLALHQPYIRILTHRTSLRVPLCGIAGRPPSRQAWSKDSTLDALYFSNNAVSRLSSSTPASASSRRRLSSACEVHRGICCILLSAYESLQCSLQSLMAKLPHHQQIEIDYLDCRKKLNAIMERIQRFEQEEDLLQTAQSDVATLCAENVILWHQYLEVVTLNDKVTHQLAKEHHLQRVKRFAEAFFTQEHPKQTAIACFDPSVHGHLELGLSVKASAYFGSMPLLAAECAEMDGDALSTPIIFEDVFCEEAPPAKQFSSECFTSRSRDRTRSVGSDASSLSDSSTSSPKFKHSSKLKFIKNIKPETFKRPSSNFTTEDVKGAVAGAREPDKCELVGYRKRDSNTFAPIMELGTLSPAVTPSRIGPVIKEGASGEESMSLSGGVGGRGSLQCAASLPTLVGEGGLSLVSSGSMPELNRTNSFRRSASDKPRSGSGGTRVSGSSSRLEQQLVQARAESLVKKLREAEAAAVSEAVNSEAVVIQDMKGISKDDREAQHVKLEDLDIEDLESESIDEAQTNAQSNIGKHSSKDTDGEAQAQSEHSRSSDAPLPAAASPNSYSSSTQSSPDGAELAAAAINGIEMEPELSNEEILHNLRDQSNGAAAAATTADYRELSVDNLAAAGTDQRCTIMELLKNEFKTAEREEAEAAAGTKLGMARLEPVVQQPRSEFSLLPQSGSPDRSHLLVSPVPDETINFITAKENLRRSLKYTGHIYSDFPSQSSTVPYFWPPEPGTEEDLGIHLVVCVHGLDGNSADLRLVRTYLEMALPGNRIDFLMSERNQPDTFADFELMTQRLIGEVLSHIEIYGMSPKRISFVGHSLGNLIIRSALGHPEMSPLLPYLHTFLSLSGPHLGTLYNSSGLVNMGMWFMQKWKKSGSLLQLSLKDHSDPRQTFLYKLSQKPGLEFFKHILLVSSQQDRYVPYHSSRMELCKAATRDTSGLGAVYTEMVGNLLKPVLYKSQTELVRYDVVHALPNTANSIIGRAAHIAVLDSEVFIEKFMTVAALKYFK